MSNRIMLKCLRCQATYPMDGKIKNCKKCGNTLQITYDYERLKDMISRKILEERVDGVWKYWPLLPCNPDKAVTLGEGNTSLIKCERLGEKIGLKNLFVKDETKNPTGSFMDRGATILVTWAKNKGYRGIYGSFKGNLGASLAAYTAKAGIKSIIVINQNVDASKLYQMIAYGATVYTREKTHGEEGIYTTDNADPLLIEGEKTITYEIIEKNNWETPDFIIAPMGTGSLISATWKAIKEYELLNLIERADIKLVGVQAEKCAPIVMKFQGESGREEFEEAGTIAIDIAFNNPKRSWEAVEALRNSNGTALKVSDEEMLWASKNLAKEEGIFAEPAAASTIAALKRLSEMGVIDPSDKVVCIITGSGLKDPLVALKELERNVNLEKFIKRREKTPRRLGIGGTKVAILKILSKNILHGYEIWRRISEMKPEISIPAVYQHLKDLERMGLISRVKSQVKAGRIRIHYGITSKGQKLLKALI